jgi:hypothetical protein
MTDNTDSTTAVAGIGVFNKSIVPPEHYLQMKDYEGSRKNTFFY